MIKGEKHKTTRAHFEKYEAMKKAAGVTLVGTTSRCAFGTVEEIEAAYRLDPTFCRSYSFDDFDRFFYLHKRDVVTSLAENLCMYKHYMLYEVLGLVPEFTD